jgi:hypothetical protein
MSREKVEIHCMRRRGFKSVRLIRTLNPNCGISTRGIFSEQDNIADEKGTNKWIYVGNANISCYRENTETLTPAQIRS